jgi:hypothetical protein
MASCSSSIVVDLVTTVVLVSYVTVIFVLCLLAGGLLVLPWLLGRESLIAAACLGALLCKVSLVAQRFSVMEQVLDVCCCLWVLFDRASRLEKTLTVLFMLLSLRRRWLL